MPTDRYVDHDALDDCEGACLERLEQLHPVVRALTMEELASVLAQRARAAKSDSEISEIAPEEGL